VNIRVVLGEDNVLVREGVRALLDATDGIEVVGVAADAPSLIALAAEAQPDVVVTDIKMPPLFQLEGIDAAHQIRESHPGTGVVVLSAHDDEAYALALLGRGQSGLAYLLKDRVSQGDELARAIREVAAGGSAIDPVIASRLSGATEAGEADREILDLMAQGLGYAEMAERLETTQEAIDARVTKLFQQLATDAGRGASHAVDELKRLHEAVVARTTSERTLRSFVPSQVAERLSGGMDAMTQEEVEATILFSDIRGFTTLAERLPAQEVAAIIGKHLSAMAEVVLDHGGTIDKFSGDAVMAVFGAPNPQEDHAELALRCALAMQDRQRDLNREGWAEDLPDLQMGIGVNTGTVIAGTVGGGGRLEYTVVGDAVNVAQRIQSEASGGQVLATAATIGRCGDASPFSWESLGPREVKGRREPVDLYLVAPQPEAAQDPTATLGAPPE
jgi:class 3 adenylate cyclase/CheY-like chemotaxis protein